MDVAEKQLLKLLRRKNRRSVPQLNTTSTADISFMLLIFFLVTTSMDVDKGLLRQLPPPEPEQEEQVADVSRDKALTIRLCDDNTVTVDDEPVAPGQMRQRIVSFISNSKAPQDHIISIDISRKADYDAYFAIQDAIVGAYNQLRNQRAMALYRQPFDACSEEQKEAVRSYYPQRVAETYPTQLASTDEEGGEP